MKEFLMILFSAILVENFVLSKFLGVCSFLGVSKKLNSALGMSAAVTFVMISVSAVSYPLYTYFLKPYSLEYMRIIVFVLVTAVFVKISEIVMKKLLPSLHKNLGIYLPLIVTNCAVMGLVLINADESYNFMQSIVNALGAGLGYTLALVIFSGIREKIDNADIPEFLKGMPITFIAASIVSVSFLGFNGMSEGLFG